MIQISDGFYSFVVQWYKNILIEPFLDLGYEIELAETYICNVIIMRLRHSQFSSDFKNHPCKFNHARM